MPQSNFQYAPADDRVGVTASVTVLVDDPLLRSEIQQDLAATGLHIAQSLPLAEFLAGEVAALGDVVLVDCAHADVPSLAALSRLDMRAQRSGAQVIVSTSAAGLEDVFGCMDQSAPQFLVAPTRADRIVALGRALASKPRLRVRELSDDDRLTLLRLTEQVGEIASRLDKLADTDRSNSDSGSAFRFNANKRDFKGAQGGDGRDLIRKPRTPLPDPRLVRKWIARRAKRAEFFDGALFSDPAWDILLDLTAARAEHTRVSVTSLCIASGVPTTTALRWIQQMTQSGLLVRVEDDTDRRRAFIALSDNAADAMARYFVAVSDDALVSA